MLLRVPAAFFAVSFLFLAGCAQGPTSSVADGPGVGGILASPAAEALWDDPQQFSHPAFGWPTLTNVPADAPEWWQPIPARTLPDPVRGLKHLTQAGEGSTGDGIAVFGRLVVTPAGQIMDITDPAAPAILSEMDIEPGARQAVILAYPDERLVAAFATGSGDIPLWDISDPRDPVPITSFKVPSGGHTIAFVPGTPILYNANAVGSRYYPHEVSGGRSIPQVEIYDLTDPTLPTLVQEWDNGYGCHEISFYINASAGKLRAYCAAVDATQIWDIADPRAPTVVSTIPMPHGQQGIPGYPILATVSHWTIVNDDATTIGVADEFLGGAGPGCDVTYTSDGKTYSGPAGNVWFYDVRDEANPVLKSWINPGSHFTYNAGSGTSCTAHIGRMVPQAERDVVAMSFYGGGIGLIDFTDAANPYFVATWQTATPMDVWYDNGYLFAGDASHGIDVLTFE
jgi:hypothetical protein